MKTITCKHCGTENGYVSRFCEACGKKFVKASASDSMFILILVILAVLAAAYAHYIGYRLTDLPKLLNYLGLR